ncbi:MAG: hypothetical protein QF785_08900 [Phycisphaeraceae bacterium]|jgi:hypothetical protein|nr:hypothetical protein [Phycisphaeraceae bacterium]
MTEPRDITNLTDEQRQLESLLDDALQPDACEVPAGMVDRIVAATVDQLPAQRRDIVARISIPAAAVRIAAAIVMAVMIGWVVTATQDTPSDFDRMLALNHELNQMAQLATLDDVDRQVDLLGVSIEALAADWDDNENEIDELFNDIQQQLDDSVGAEFF